MQSMSLEQVEQVIDNWPTDDKLRLVEGVVKRLRGSQADDAGLDHLCREFYLSLPDAEREESDGLEKAGLEVLASCESHSR